MASTGTTQSDEKKRALIGRKKTGKKSVGRRRNGAISAGTRKAANNNGVVLPRMEFEMALEIAGPDQKTWTANVRDAAEAAGGDLLFVLPHGKAGDGEGGGAAARDHAMVRLVEDGESRLLLVRAGAAGFHLVEEDAIEDELVRFAHASIDVLERLAADNRIVAPLVTLARH